jgi:DNA (cytosine-5)-methyltransferase 1
MNELALFAGAGGGILGAHLLGWRTICAVEKEPYCREVLLRRQRDGVLPLFPIWDDCNTFDGRPWRGLVDVVTAGFPCQPFSFGGKQDAEQDSRDGWPTTIRILGEVKPRFALLENVPGLLSWSHGYFGRILGGLAEIGYDAVWDCLPASAVGAPHRRDRLWVLAYPSGIRCRQDAKEVSFSGDREERKPWQTEPDVGRVVNGLAHRVDRLRALGNGQVASVVPLAWNTLIAKI